MNCESQFIDNIYYLANNNRDIREQLLNWLCQKTTRNSC